MGQVLIIGGGLDALMAGWWIHKRRPQWRVQRASFNDAKRNDFELMAPFLGLDPSGLPRLSPLLAQLCEAAKITPICLTEHAATSAVVHPELAPTPQNTASLLSTILQRWAHSAQSRDRRATASLPPLDFTLGRACKIQFGHEIGGLLARWVARRCAFGHEDLISASALGLPFPNPQIERPEAIQIIQSLILAQPKRSMELSSADAPPFLLCSAEAKRLIHYLDSILGPALALVGAQGDPGKGRHFEFEGGKALMPDAVVYAPQRAEALKGCLLGLDIASAFLQRFPENSLTYLHLEDEDMFTQSHAWSLDNLSTPPADWIAMRSPERLYQSADSRRSTWLIKDAFSEQQHENNRRHPAHSPRLTHLTKGKVSHQITSTITTHRRHLPIAIPGFQARLHHLKISLHIGSKAQLIGPLVSPQDFSHRLHELDQKMSQIRLKT